MGVDIVADVKLDHISLLKQELEESYYINGDMIKEAIERNSSFNLIHLDTAIKIDVFVVKNVPYHQHVLERRIKDTLEDNDT